MACVAVLCAGCASTHREVTAVNARPIAVATFMASPTPSIMRRLQTSVPRPLPPGEIGFFPNRPRGVAISLMRGIVTDYGIGMKQGHVVIQTHAGATMDFFVGYPLRVNGVQMRDPFPPSGLTVGKTPATVTYWTTTYNQKRVHVTDQVDY
jgi:hypothetical protein